MRKSCAPTIGWSVHRRIFDAISKLIAAGSPANPVTLKHLFDADPVLWKAYKGGRYLVQLAQSAITVSNAPDYALIILDLALRRDFPEAFDFDNNEQGEE